MGRVWRGEGGGRSRVGQSWTREMEICVLVANAAYCLSDMIIPDAKVSQCALEDDLPSFEDAITGGGSSSQPVPIITPIVSSKGASVHVPFSPAHDDLPASLPPAFAPFNADFRRLSDGNVISHDPHLNEDGTHRRVP